MGASGRERVVQYGWENIAAKVEEYYRFVIRRVALHGPLPPHVNPSLALSTRDGPRDGVRDALPPRVTAVGPGLAASANQNSNKGDEISPLQAKG